MRRLLAVLAVYTILVLPAAIWATGSLTIPNTIFTHPNPVPTSKLDQNWTAIANYVNAREVSFGLLGSRPVAGTAGRYYFGTDTGAFYADNGTSWVQLSSAPLIAQRASLTIANATNSTANINIFPGQAVSDDALATNRIMIELTSTLTKKPGTAWAVGSGNGCLDTGAAAAFTWYHIFVIERVDTGVVDALCSTSATSPTMPASYTKKQRVGSIQTTWFGTAGAEIYQFVQVKNKFRWATTTHTQDVNNATPGAGTSVIATLSVPNGVIVDALVGCASVNTGQVLVSEVNVTDETAAGALQNCSAFGGAMGVQVRVTTDTARQVRYQNAANVSTVLRTFGWYELWD